MLSSSGICLSSLVPLLIYLNDAIESLQQSYTKRLTGFNKLTYSERFHKLKLQSLEHRCLICDLVLCYNGMKVDSDAALLPC